jgi:signal transduction histidine kinase
VVEAMTLLINNQRLGPAPARRFDLTLAWSWTFTLLVFTPVYFLALANADYFALGEEAISVFWPANGLLLGALLLNRLRRWPVLVLISIICELIHAMIFSGSAAAKSVMLHLANPLEVLLAGWLMVLFVRYSAPSSYARRTLIFILLASVIAAGTGSFLGASAFVQVFPDAPFAYTWQVWWLSDGLGFIIVTPAVVWWGERLRGNMRPLAVTGARIIETIVMTLGLIGSVLYVFGGTHEAPFSVFDFPYITVPFALWAAFHLTGDGAALMYLILSGLAAWLTSKGTGPYQLLAFDLYLQALALQTYLFTSFLMILLINAVVRDREEAEHINRETERVLKRTQHMERVSQVATGVAHDFNNCLTGILGCSEFLGRGETLSEVQQKHMETIRGSALKGAALAKKLMNLGRPDADALQRCDLGEVLKESEKLLRRQVKHIHKLTCTVCDMSPKIMADPVELEEILMNLVINARDAMPESGSIDVVVGPPSRELLSKIGDGVTLDSHLMLEVSDTGTGMTEDVIEKAFEPYFTTKGDRGGTGLGLARVYAIVQRHNAILHVRSQPGEGTRFQMLFPMCIE